MKFIFNVVAATLALTAISLPGDRAQTAECQSSKQIVDERTKDATIVWFKGESARTIAELLWWNSPTIVAANIDQLVVAYRLDGTVEIVPISNGQSCLLGRTMSLEHFNQRVTMKGLIDD